MYLGLLVAMVVASQLPGLSTLFRGSSDPIGLVLAASVIFAVGMVDDLREMSPPAKMSGQILAGTVLYLFGVNMLFFRLPFAGTTVVLSADLIPVLTVLWVVGMANAVNFIDGLDGLAAGIVGIASLAFFVYSHQLVHTGHHRRRELGAAVRGDHHRAVRRASCPTTSIRPGSSWATPGPCCSGCSWPRPPCPWSARPTSTSAGGPTSSSPR